MMIFIEMAKCLFKFCIILYIDFPLLYSFLQKLISKQMVQELPEGEKFIFNKLQLEKFQNGVTNEKFNIRKIPGLFISLTNHRLFVQTLNAQQPPRLKTQYEVSINSLSECTQYQRQKNILKFVSDSRGERIQGNPISAKFINPEEASKFLSEVQKLRQKLKKNPNFVQFSRMYAIVKDSIFNSTPYLRELYFQIHDRLKSKGILDIQQLDNLMLNDHPQMRKFLTMQKTEAYQVEKQVILLNLEDKHMDIQNEGRRVMEGYSAQKQLEGFKLIQDEKKQQGDIERRKKQDIFLASIEEIQYDDLMVEDQQPSPKYLQKNEQFELSGKFQISNKQYRIWQIKQMANDQRTTLHQKKNKMTPENEKSLRQILELTKIMYKLMRMNQQIKIVEIKSMLTQMRQKQHQHPYSDQLMRKANQNYLIYKKGKLFI